MAGAQTVPHRHASGRALVHVEGEGVVADESGVHVVHAGDIVSNPPGGWHWHGATPNSAATHVGYKPTDDLDLNVERRDWGASYTQDLGK